MYHHYPFCSPLPCRPLQSPGKQSKKLLRVLPVYGKKGKALIKRLVVLRRIEEGEGRSSEHGNGGFPAPARPGVRIPPLCHPWKRVHTLQACCTFGQFFIYCAGPGGDDGIITEEPTIHFTHIITQRYQKTTIAARETPRSLGVCHLPLGLWVSGPSAPRGALPGPQRGAGQ